MKNIIFFLSLLIFFFCSTIVSGQEANSQIFTFFRGQRYVEDKIPIAKFDISITYEYEFMVDTINHIKFKDRYVLEVGDDRSHFYSQYSEICDSIMFVARNKSMSEGVNNSSWLKNKEVASYEDVIFNYPDKGIITVTSHIGDNEFFYEEKIPALAWELDNDNWTEILGYKCQSASIKFRGRVWKAWFTHEIPISIGPWKFSGLPGTILRLTDSENLFSYNAIGILSRKGTIYIHNFKKSKKKQLSRTEYMQLKKKLWEDPISIYLMQGVNFSIADEESGQTRKADMGDLSFPYQPSIELE